MAAIRGYLTFTGDIPHEGHFSYLKWCKQQCDHLTIGLTTDERVTQEKRVPMISFKQRRSIWENCKYVDFVVAHSGDPKAVAWDKMRFDILFSDEDYMNSVEFKDFKRNCPDVPVRFMPKYPDMSSTLTIHNLMQRFCDSQQIIAPGIAGYVVRQGFGPFQVVKPIHFALEECHEKIPNISSDVFGFFANGFSELPRNWKSKHHHVSNQAKPLFPMISGINTNREIAVNILLQKKPWCTYVSTVTVYDVCAQQRLDQNLTTRTTVGGDDDGYILPSDNNITLNTEEKQKKQRKFASLLEFATHVAYKRQFPAKIVNLIQRDGGITFEQWCKTICRTKSDFDAKLLYINNTIIADLKSEGIVHGDIHPRNLLVEPKTGQIFLIDFGWVTARFFDLCEKETEYLESLLISNFDLEHFRKIDAYLSCYEILAKL